SLLYGPKIDVVRSHSFQYQGDLKDDPVLSTLGCLLSILPFGCVMLEEALRSSNNDPIHDKDASWFVYNLPWQILEVVLAGWERNKCVAQSLKKSLVAAIGLKTELALLQANPLPLQTAGDYNFPSRLTTVQQHLVNSSALATLAAGATPNVDSEGNQDVQVI